MDRREAEPEDGDLVREADRVTVPEDVQQAVGPLIFLAMAGYFASFTGLNDPDAGWVEALSLVPFFSPYLMPARMLLTSVDPAEVLLALALLGYAAFVGAMIMWAVQLRHPK